ncbi:MAG: aldehyde dehydrogenase family protein, partial [bacterium]
MTTTIHAGLWIDGQEVPTKSSESFPVIDPGLGETFGVVAKGSQEDIDRAIEAAQRAFVSPSWRALDPYQRGHLLWRWARKIEEEKDSIAQILSMENGKPIRQAYDEVGTTIRNLEYFAGWADKIYGRVIPARHNVFDYTLLEPLGVVGHIIPWNYPLDIFARGVAPCLAIGNTVVAKPAEETPFSTLKLARLATEVGFPDGVINVVTGFGSEAGVALASHIGIQSLAFCGSIETGKSVLKAAAQNITPVVSLELGGKSPCLVFQDADTKRAAETVAWGICYNTGQSCGALSRLLVQRGLLESITEKLKSIMASIQLGYGQKDPDMGPLVSAKQLESVLNYIQVGNQEGAKLIYGGHRAVEGNLARGFFIEPTLFGEVHQGMRIVQEEIFGPVVGVSEFDTEEEAIALANDTKYGLSAEIWTRDLSRVHRLATQIDVSHITV